MEYNSGALYGYAVSEPMTLCVRQKLGLRRLRRRRQSRDVRWDLAGNYSYDKD